jgi:putative hemolysin
VNNFWVILIGFLVLLVLDLATVAARVGLLHTSLARLLAQRETGEEMIQPTLHLVQNLTRLQASLNLARLIWRFLIAGLILIYLYTLTQTTSVWLVVSILLLAAFLVFWLEWVVSVHVIKEPLSWAFRMTPFTRALMFLLTPFVLLPLMSSGEVETTPETTGPLAITEDDLKVMVNAGQQEGLFEPEEQMMIYSIFDLGNRLAREIMIPRIDVLALDVETELAEAIDALIKSGYSRVPVYVETVDNILGLLYAKDLLSVWREGNKIESLRELLRPAYFVPEAKKVDELLTELQGQRVHMAIVVDEYGGVAGVVTLEDIVEEILGEIQDEYDDAEESPYEELSANEFIFLGRVDLDDFNEIVEADLPKDDADTLGGYIYSRLGRVPTAGESVQVDNMQLTVEQVIGRRIRKVRVLGLQAEAAQKVEER